MAQVRRWQIESGGKEQVVEYVVRAMGDGEVLVDGKVVVSWGSSWWSLPKEMRFEIDGKPAMLRRTGLMSQHFDFVYEGKVHTEKQGRGRG